MGNSQNTTYSELSTSNIPKSKQLKHLCDLLNNQKTTEDEIIEIIDTFSVESLNESIIWYGSMLNYAIYSKLKRLADALIEKGVKLHTNTSDNKSCTFNFAYYSGYDDILIKLINNNNNIFSDKHITEQWINLFCSQNKWNILTEFANNNYKYGKSLLLFLACKNNKSEIALKILDTKKYKSKSYELIMTAKDYAIINNMEDVLQVMEKNN
jgi:predicted Zn-ribbon and HTH transcriptional regulator